jgi:hypothetical protein
MALKDKEEGLLLASAVFKLVDNNSTNDDATLDNLLPISRHVHQVEDIV